MKKLCVAVSALMLFASVGAYAQSAFIDVKAGAAYAKDAEKVGFNSTVAIGGNLNPYFAIFGKPGFTWFSWDEGLGIYKYAGPGLTTELKQEVDAYCFPLIAGAKIMMADAKESIGIVPYVSAGAGYTWMKYKYKVPAYDVPPAGTVHVDAISDKMTFKGFTWEVIGGFDYKFSGTNMALGVEGGYRSMKLKKGDFEANMSGWVANAGVSFALGGMD